MAALEAEGACVDRCLRQTPKVVEEAGDGGRGYVKVKETVRALCRWKEQRVTGFEMAFNKCARAEINRRQNVICKSEINFAAVSLFCPSE
jgi:hypothetical protein